MPRDAQGPERNASGLPPDSRAGISRRSFLKGVGAAAGGAAAASWLARAGEPPSTQAPVDAEEFPADGFDAVLKVNGREHSLRLKPSTTLLIALREQLGFTGAKEVCSRGACGACTVLVAGKAINACMMLAVDAIGQEVTTIEGLSRDGRLHPIQAAFARHDACQCGYCIPGFVMRTEALLRENPHPDLAQIKRGLSGNLCRCGSYVKIFDAVTELAGGGA